MFDTTWIAELDADTACEVVLANQAALREQEFRELAMAAHWADLHPGEARRPMYDPHDPTPAPGSRVLPGTERAIRIGGTAPRTCGSSRAPSWVC